MVLIGYLLAAVGCATPREKGVTRGMTMEEVKSLIGPPTRTSNYSCPGKKSCIEIWQYDGNNVTFTDGIVVATQ